MTALSSISHAADSSPQIYEVRSYLLAENSDVGAIDAYLRDALIPALQRQGIGPIGAFTNAANDESGSRRIVVVIPYADANAVVSSAQTLRKDAQYAADAKEYLGRAPDNPPYLRITSELLTAMDCMPKLAVAKESLLNGDRVYELRLYESPSEQIGDLKVDMFNSGEVPIFLDSGVQPIFIGQCVIGPQTPSLTYLTVYPNEEARIEAWKAFRIHPDWKVLSKVPKYKGTVSHIDKYLLLPKPYSQM
ncbi:NIPSNAP family protein [Novipirellula artificiosorum]|nr:NIPSNAP family protein [Novipirellula artificiosorum]